MYTLVQIGDPEFFGKLKATRILVLHANMSQNVEVYPDSVRDLHFNIVSKNRKDFEHPTEI